MSFILDALRRAERQRGNQPVTVAPDSALLDIAEKPPAKLSARSIALTVTGGLLLALLAASLLNRSDPVTAGQSSPGNRMQQQPGFQPAPFPSLAPDTPLAEVATAANREIRPLNREARVSDYRANAAPPVPDAVTSEQTRSSRTGPGQAASNPNRPIKPGTVTYSQEPLSASDSPARTLTNLPGNAESLPSYQDMILTRGIQLPVFNLDIHVFAANPDRRFVFVNNRKYREGDGLDEGGTVERITPVGVVLNHRGRRFELLPD